jgi:DNA-binding transcriptional LysR family regulator
MEPSSSDLKYFLEVVRAGNMSKAASKLGISQPSLSLAIQRIEKCLGEVILLRDRTGAKPTMAGDILIKKTHKLIEAWNDVKGTLNINSDGVMGSIVIGCHPEVAIDSLPLFLPKLLNGNPNLEIHLKHDISRVITEDVINGKIDVGIVVNPRSYPELVIKTLSYDTVGLWKVNGKKTKELDALICQPELVQSQKIMREASKKGYKFKRTILSSDIQVICSLVASGCGVGILSREIALRNPTHNLTEISDGPLLKDQVALIYRHENKNMNLFKTATAAIVAGHEMKYGKI